uniref:Uncharacterized protein n=1 Tax=Rhizophora mucronata TaxID=61149 RepID=A0A2P2NCC0_RHIMU
MRSKIGRFVRAHKAGFKIMKESGTNEAISVTLDTKDEIAHFVGISYQCLPCCNLIS